jgi:nicotinate phosphoribosyltransferase
VGTSNAYFAMKHNFKPIGTMAHKAICAYQQLEGCRTIDSQKAMFQDWAQEYRGDLGIALSDTLGFSKFLYDFDKYFAKLFDGARHDSGDPYVWGHMLIDMYESMNINPLTKTGVWSDGLTFSSAIDIHNHFEGMIQRSFGPGTKFTNDVGYVAPQIVIKLVECNGKPVAKVSDDPGKSMCEDKDYIKYLDTLL